MTREFSVASSSGGAVTAAATADAKGCGATPSKRIGSCGKGLLGRMNDLVLLGGANILSPL